MVPETQLIKLFDAPAGDIETRREPHDAALGELPHPRGLGGLAA